MLFLATFFPMSDLEEEEGEHQFDLLNDFLRATVDIADLVGIYLVMSRVAGKGSVKVLVAGLSFPSTSPEDLIQVESDGFLLDEGFNFSRESWWE